MPKFKKFASGNSKLAVMLTIVAMFIFVGCSKDDDITLTNNLVGTSWITYFDLEDENDGYVRFSFTTKTKCIWNNGSMIYGDLDSEELAYTYNKPNIIIYDEYISVYGKINGNKMELTYPEDGVLIFTKQ